MKLWKKAIGAIKDKNSIVVVYISRRNSLRNPDLEAAIIKATSHDEHGVDKRNAQIVFSWIRTSPISIRPLIRALSKRMDKTRSWVVAIKGLMLMHGVLHCKVPVVKLMQRLPFDLSSFSDGHSKASQTWGFNCIIREYFAFLDQRAAVYLSEQHRDDDGDDDDDNDDNNERSLMVQQVLRLERWQSLLDLLIQIRPRAENMKVNLIMEVMDCVIIEIFDAYSIICSGIAKVVLNIHSFNKFEASMVLKVLQRARKQDEELNLFFEFCREFGVWNAIQFPMAIQIPEEGVEEELERIINGVSEYKQTETESVPEEHSKGGLRTIITDKWVVFDEEKYSYVAEEEEEDDDGAKKLALAPLVSIDNVPVYYKHYEVPDLICF